MFPTNLHKNIVQLDRQISLLENECKNMELEKRKKNSKEQSLNAKCSKISNMQLKSPPVKVTLKKSGYECSRRNKKLTPPISTRVHSTSSLQSSKPWSEIYEPLGKRKDKSYANFHACSCQLIENSNQLQSRKENKFVKCACCKDNSVSDFIEKDIHENSLEKFDECKKDEVLHKEVLFSNPDGTIEVTVTKKSSNGKEKSPLKKFVSVGNTNEKNLDSCKCQIQGQKWSEILGLDSSKRRTVSHGNSPKDELEVIYQPYKSNAVHNHEKPNTKNLPTKSENFDAPVKLAPSSSRVKKPMETIVSPPEKETQCYPENNQCKEPIIQDPIKLFQILVNELKHKPNEEKKKLLNDMESSIFKFPVKSSSQNMVKGLPEGSADPCIKKTDLISVMKQHCESLLKEKETLSEELAAKDNTIETMKKREEEYLSLIASLKSNLEKTKENAQDGISALKELNNVRSKLLEEIKVTEALKKSHMRMQDMMEKCVLENDKLKTQIQIFKLESEKHDVLLAGKEAEINRYKEEIKNFQSQISDHLASLKSNAQEIDVEKMMEAIIQQSHLFVQTDLDSVVLEDDQRASSKQQNVLMHSSPTSTKTSVVNSSWKQISSIRDHDQTKANSEILPEGEEKEFFQVFGGDTSDSESSKKSKETLIEKLAQMGEKKTPDFTSCISVQDDSAMKREVFHNKEKNVREVKGKNKHMPSQKVQRNIDELLQNMKLKWSHEVYGTSREDCTIEDFLNNSQISSISMNSENVPSLETSK